MASDYQTLLNIESSGHLNPAQKTELEQYRASGAGGGSGLQAYDDLLKSMPKVSDFASQINKVENQAFGDYMDYVKTAPTSAQFYKDQLDQSGIPQLQKTQSTLQGQIYDLEDTLRRVEPNVNATTQNSMVTEAQRRGMVESRQKPLVENLGWLGQSLGRVSSAIQQGKQDILTLTGLNQQDQARVVDMYKTRLDLVSQQGGRALEAFVTDINNTLNVTLSKIHRGEQLDDIEKANAFELMKMEKQAQIELDQQIKLNEMTPNTQLIDLGARKVLIDAGTGREIKSYDEVSSGGSGTAWGNTTVTPTSPKPTTSPTGSSISTSVDPTLFNYLYGTTTAAPSGQLAYNNTSYGGSW